MSDNVEQLTPEQAKAIYESESWKAWPTRDLALMQLQQRRLFMPMDLFHKAVEEAAGRPVWIHELALNDQRLIAELKGEAASPTFEAILGLLPAEKTVVVAIDPHGSRNSGPDDSGA